MVLGEGADPVSAGSFFLLLTVLPRNSVRVTWKEKATKASRQDGVLSHLFTNRVRTREAMAMYSLGLFILRKEEEEEKKRGRRK